MKWYLLVLKKYATFSGRARRKEYWYFTLFSVLISVVLSLSKINLLDTLYSMAVLVPTIAVGVRRMHDINKSGWYCLIPIYNLILACRKGTEGPNEYGNDPKLEELLEEVQIIGGSN